MDTKLCEIQKDISFPFRNNVDFCVGTGRMGLALQKEYMEQLKLVQEHIGFRYIRGHGLFCDDMAIYQEYENHDGQTKVEYNFTYLDMVMDHYLEVGIRPFLELGFMPYKLASGEQVVFYWKGNVTPPKSYEAWEELVKATLRHLIDRYGEKEVLSWPIEVWNEPNLAAFFENADMKEYFRLYRHTVMAVKAVHPGLKVGGPAICGVNDELWMREFLKFTCENHVPLDFITRHHYMIELPENIGHYGYVKLCELHRAMAELNTTREIVDGFAAYKDMDIHITEFNTAYIPNAPIHDTNLNAAYIAQALSLFGDHHASYAYWTFGDIFEESGVPFTPFHGGFGLVANGCIPKPSFWAFAFYKQLKGECVFRSEDTIVVKDGKYCGIAWNPCYNGKDGELKLTYRFPADKGEYCLITKTVDEDSCNPLKVWHDLGEPSSLSREQKELLRMAAFPAVSSQRVDAQNDMVIEITLKENAIVFFTLESASIDSDRGYSFTRASS